MTESEKFQLGQLTEGFNGLCREIKALREWLEKTAHETPCRDLVEARSKTADAHESPCDGLIKLKTKLATAWVAICTAGAIVGFVGGILAAKHL